MMMKNIEKAPTEREKKKTNGIIKKNKNTVNVRQILLIKKEILL